MEEFNNFFNQSVLNLGTYEIKLGLVLLVPFVIILGYSVIKFFYRRLNKLMESKHVNSDVVLLFRRLYKLIAYTLLAFIVLELIGVPLTAFAFVSGALAIAIGFGAQNILNNFISGWILMWERPIRIGDFLEVQGMKGKVVTINTRSTLVRRVDGVYLLIPNSFFLENTVVNWTVIDKQARGEVKVGVSYDSDPEHVRTLILESIADYDDILLEPEPVVIFEDFGDNALVFILYFWIEDFSVLDLRAVKSEVRYRMAAKFKEAGIVISFPQRDIHVDGSLTIARSINEKGIKKL